MRFAAEAAKKRLTDYVIRSGLITAQECLHCRYGRCFSETLRNNIESELQVHGAGLDSMTQIKTAAHQARGIEAGGQAQAAATRASGFNT